MKRQSNNLILLLLFQISGILIAHYYPFAIPHLLFAFCILVLSFYLFPKLFWMAFGFFVVALSAHHTKDSYPKEIGHTSMQWRVFFVEEEQKKTAKFYKYEAIFEQHKIVLFSKKPLVKNAFYLVKSSLNVIENFSTTFDYKTYLAKKGIRYQSRITTARYLHSSKKLKSRVISHLQTIWKNHLPEHLYGFTQTLLLGDKKDLDPLVLSKFQYVGIAHVLAISGMHIGLLFIMLERITLWFNKIAQLLVPLSILWSYAALLGFSPSASRAVLGISIWLFLKHLHKWTSPIHILLLTAFISICFNPYLIFDVGFQFSYSAVLGILLFYPLLNKRVLIKNRIIKNITQIVLISFCAQLGVLPLSLHYFHLFPSLFLLSNLLISPLFPLILFTAIGVCIFPSLSSLYIYSVEVLFQIVNLLDSQCWSYFYVFQVSKLHVLGVYIILYHVYLYLLFQSKNEIYSLYIPKKIGPWYRYFYLKCKQKPLLYIIRGALILLIIVLFSERLPLIY